MNSKPPKVWSSAGGDRFAFLPHLEVLGARGPVGRAAGNLNWWVRKISVLVWVPMGRLTDKAVGPEGVPGKSTCKEVGEVRQGREKTTYGSINAWVTAVGIQRSAPLGTH